LANYFVFPVASNRKQHEFFKAIVLAHEMTIALRGTSAPSFPDYVVEHAFTSSPYRKKHLSQKGSSSSLRYNRPFISSPHSLMSLSSRAQPSRHTPSTILRTRSQ
jgi:hypothetical protein